MKMKQLHNRFYRILRWIAMVLVLSLQYLLEGSWSSSGPRETT